MFQAKASPESRPKAWEKRQERHCQFRIQAVEQWARELQAARQVHHNGILNYCRRSPKRKRPAIVEVRLQAEKMPAILIVSKIPRQLHRTERKGELREDSQAHQRLPLLQLTILPFYKGSREVRPL